MLTKVFAIYDSKVEAYLQPFFSMSTGSAIRAFSDAVQNPQSQFNKHSADFTLFELGTYDDMTGTLISHNAKIPLGTALEFKGSSSSESHVQL